MKDNKWTLKISNKYEVGDENITRTETVAIPPTNGDRIDVIGTSGKYYYNTSKSKFSERLTKEEYVTESLNVKGDKDRKEALKNIEWTPMKIEDNIDLVIKIKSGEITVSHKF